MRLSVLLGLSGLSVLISSLRSFIGAIQSFPALFRVIGVALLSFSAVGVSLLFAAMGEISLSFSAVGILLLFSAVGRMSIVFEGGSLGRCLLQVRGGISWEVRVDSLLLAISFCCSS